MLKMLDICFGVYTLIMLGKAGMDFQSDRIYPLLNLPL